MMFLSLLIVRRNRSVPYVSLRYPTLTLGMRSLLIQIMLVDSETNVILTIVLNLLSESRVAESEDQRSNLISIQKSVNSDA